MIGNLTVKTVEGSYRDIALGPVAALESIKHLGTNGGGFLEPTLLRLLRIPRFSPIWQKCFL